MRDTKLRGDLTRSQTGNFRRPVLHSNTDLFETFDHGETHEGEEREERKTQAQKQARKVKLADLYNDYNYNTHVSMDTCSHVATDFVSDVLLSLNLLVFVRDDTSYVRSDPNLCLFHSIWVLFSHKRRRTDSSSDEDVFIQSSKRYDDCIIST